MKSSFWIAIIVAIAAIVWIGSGQVDDGAAPGDAAAAASPSATPAPSPRAVRVLHSTAREVVSEISLAGITEPERTVDIRAKRGGTVGKLPLDKGAEVAEGALLVGLTEDSYRIAVEAATALREQRKMQFEAAQKLARRGFESEVRTAETAADLATAIATLSEAELAFERSDITAPFGGIISERMVEMGDWVENGQVVARVVDLDPLKITAYVSEANLPRLDKTAPVKVRIPGIGQKQAQISYISPIANAETRTFRIEMNLPNEDGALAAGLTCELTLPVSRRTSHVISPALLTLADDGTLGVKLVQDDNRVHFTPVNLVGETDGGIAVTGLPDTATIITVGQDFVAENELVTPVTEDEIRALQAASATEQPASDDAASNQEQMQ